jgi:hypothetical protein
VEAGLLRRRSHEGDCRNRPTKLFHFRRGQILIKEGDDAYNILFV